MKCFFNCVLIFLGALLCIIYFLVKNKILYLTAADQISIVGIVAVFGAMLISLGLLNIFITFYIAEESEK